MTDFAVCEWCEGHTAGCRSTSLRLSANELRALRHLTPHVMTSAARIGIE
jgi:hypothetical protein